MKPRIVLTVLYRAPAVTIEPTKEIPEIALVADISGVCSNGGTRDIVASVIIVITLMIRPYGLFGHEQIERV